MASGERSAGSTALPDPDDFPSGPVGWEKYRLRAFWSRVERAVEAGGPVSGSPGERVRVEDRPRPLPPASDLEELLRDVLDAAYGPPVVESVPERFRGNVQAVAALRRQREERARAKRRAALRRIAKRFQKPIPPGRWRVLAPKATGEYERREEQEDRLTPWWVRPNAPRESLLRATALGLADERVRTATVEELAGRLKTAIGDALGSDLTGVDWVARSEPPEKRRPPPADVDEVPEALLRDRAPHEDAGPLAALVAAEEGRDPLEGLHRLATDRQREQLEEIRRQLADGFDLPEAKRRAAKTLDVSVNALDATLCRLRSKAG